MILDLFDIAAAVLALDGTIKRGSPIRPQMGSDWRRQFDVTMHVRNPMLWNSAEVMEALTDAVQFLTEDSFTFLFHQVAIENTAQPFLDLDPAGAAFHAENVILFSGGLDSYAGALEVLSTTQSSVILVTHRSAQKVIPRQVELGGYLASRFPGRVLHIQVLARRVGPEAEDSTQRSRSFFFAALAQLVAAAFGAKRICFFENGIISHNLPLTPQIVGSMATRTTHPLSLTKLNTLMKCLGDDLAPIENRYQWLTKTDVVRRIAENGGAEKIAVAVSCTSIREQTTLHTHCGACSQCLDRRFAILAAGLEAHDFETDYHTDVLFGSRDGDASRTMALEWTRHTFRLSAMDETEFMKEFGLELTRIARGHPTMPASAVISQTREMHSRHSRSVRDALNRIVVDHSDDLLAQSLPATSLLVMWLGQPAGNADRLPEDPRTSVEPRATIGNDDEEDIVLNPDAPLKVAFLEEDNRYVVAVRGLGRVAGQPARIPHALKPTFDGDLADRLPPEKHRYVHLISAPSLPDMNKASIMSNVRRCRNALAQYFEAVHGRPPDGDLLIQNRAGRGYRLDPMIELVPPRNGDL
ncbi:MAG: hypothetical protein CMH12_10660 [Maritimibacter sp.]|nr:hypothetical protein [Maritimibacter sp.]